MKITTENLNNPSFYADCTLLSSYFGLDSIKFTEVPTSNPYHKLVKSVPLLSQAGSLSTCQANLHHCSDFNRLLARASVAEATLQPGAQECQKIVKIDAFLLSSWSKCNL